MCTGVEVPRSPHPAQLQGAVIGLVDWPKYMPQDRGLGSWVMPAPACAWVGGPACVVKCSPDVSNI